MTALYVFLAILGIFFLMVVHEGGHYLAARAFDMRVLRFSIGFGPTLFRYRPKGTDTIFQIAVIPFLAYVQIAGMNPHEEVDADDPEIFPNKSAFARVVTILAGPVANYLAASAIILVVALSSWPQQLPVVAEVMEDMPAAQAELRPGDVIVAVNGEAISSFDELKEITTARPGMPTEYVVERDGERLAPVTITPADEPQGGLIGMRPDPSAYDYVQLEVGEAAVMALKWPYERTLMQIQGLARMFERRTMEGLGGPVKMGSVVVDAAERGWVEFMLTIAFISAALGFFNLLPFPALDGGRLCFLAYEVVTRRRANEKIEAAIHTVGILFLLGLMILVTYRDIVN